METFAFLTTNFFKLAALGTGIYVFVVSVIMAATTKNYVRIRNASALSLLTFAFCIQEIRWYFIVGYDSGLADIDTYFWVMWESLMMLLALDAIRSCPYGLDHVCEFQKAMADQAEIDKRK